MLSVVLDVSPLFSLPVITDRVNREEAIRSEGECASYDQPKFDGTNSKIRTGNVYRLSMAQMGHIKVVGCRDENRGAAAMQLVTGIEYRR